MRPKVVAVVGASEGPSQSALNTRMIAGWCEELGRTWIPVNPNRSSVAGKTCYPSLTAIEQDVDVAIVITQHASDAIKDASEAGIGFVSVFSAGFAETGDVSRQQELLGHPNVRILGPNTPLNMFQPFRDDLPGKRIGLITQSGHQGRPIYQAQRNGLALAGWAPTGNESDLESADFIAAFADDDNVGAIAMYIEGFADGRTLMLAADHAIQRGVPITTIKVGRSDLGKSWAQSHSGHLAGSDTVTAAVFRQTGITRVDGLDELADVSMMFARAKPPAGDGIAIYSISGGTCSHMADWASSMGLTVPPLSEATQATLREHIPGFLRVSNPIDSGGIATGDERGRLILDAILADENVSALICPVAGSFSPISDKLAQDLVDAAATTDKPVCVIWGSPTADEPGYTDVLLPSQLPVFRSARNCLTAVRAWQDYHAFRARYRSPRYPKRASAQAAAAREHVAAGPMSEARSTRVLSAYDIPVARSVLVTSAAEAARAAGDIGFPVVMKASAPSALHKSDAGLVVLGLTGAREVREAFADLSARAPDDLEGILVQEMITGGIETIVGVVRDELFGPTVMFGLGGIAVEVFADVTFRVPPFDRAEAQRMIREITAYPMLTGARGRPKANLKALTDVIMKVQSLALDLHDDIVELDINPLLVTPERAVALDALVIGR